MQGCGAAGAPGNGVPVNIFVQEWRSLKHVSYQREHWYQSVPVIFFWNSDWLSHIYQNMQVFIGRKTDTVHVTILSHFCTSTVKLYRSKITIN